MSYVYEELSTTEIARRLCGDINAAWSFEGGLAMAEWLQELAAQEGKPIELDIVALRCDYSEYKDLAAVQAEYSDIEDMEDLQEATTVIEFDGGLIVGSF